jgi:hypothetical protein
MAPRDEEGGRRENAGCYLAGEARGKRSPAYAVSPFQDLPAGGELDWIAQFTEASWSGKGLSSVPRLKSSSVAANGALIQDPAIEGAKQI